MYTIITAMMFSNGFASCVFSAPESVSMSTYVRYPVLYILSYKSPKGSCWYVKHVRVDSRCREKNSEKLDHNDDLCLCMAITF